MGQGQLISCYRLENRNRPPRQARSHQRKSGAGRRLQGSDTDKSAATRPMPSRERCPATDEEQLPDWFSGVCCYRYSISSRRRSSSGLKVLGTIKPLGVSRIRPKP